jgi:hypothetical protein
VLIAIGVISAKAQLGVILVVERCLEESFTITGSKSEPQTAEDDELAAMTAHTFLKLLGIEGRVGLLSVSAVIAGTASALARVACLILNVHEALLALLKGGSLFVNGCRQLSMELWMSISECLYMICNTAHTLVISVPLLLGVYSSTRSLRWATWSEGSGVSGEPEDGEDIVWVELTSLARLQL